MPPTISRGFRGRRQGVPPGRVPPGQYVTREFPVLSAGNEEYLLASIQQRGMGRVEQDGTAATLSPGDIAVYDSTRPYMQTRRK
jgi:AraC-binding-like domain